MGEIESEVMGVRDASFGGQAKAVVCRCRHSFLAVG